MRFTLLSLLWLGVVFNSHSQSRIILYKIQSGKTYTRSQIDSISGLGFQISISSKEERADTIFLQTEIQEKTSQGFAAKFENSQLASLVLTDIKGQKIEIEKLRGKCIMINFWSTTCGPCIAEMPQLNELKKKFDQNCVFIAIAPEGPEEITNILEKHKFDFIIVGNSASLFKQLGIDGYPKNFFVDKKGIIRSVKEGTPYTRDSENDPWRVAVLENYAKILTEIIKLQ